MNFIRLCLSILALAALLAFAAPARGQDESLTLKLNRNWGYGGFGGEIQGTFSVSVEGPDDLTAVRYFIDDVLLGGARQPPDFRVVFVTDDYAPGRHALYAVGFRADGSELRSQELVRIFLSAEDAGGQAFGLLGPILAIVGVAAALAGLAPLLAGRRKATHRPGVYGLMGGAVCPKCGRPFSLSFFGLKLGFSRLERCLHCGRWSLVRRASPDDLAAAEALMSAEDQAGSAGESEAERLRRMVDESRYED
ncbi:MAG: Ig-like domain-containing protein [Chloroflexi bacterium]|nr:Ig-like domain-containing protein [Chloroflexota bacterium]